MFSVINLLTYGLLAVLPAIVLVFSTARITLVAVRVHKDIAIQVHVVLSSVL